MNARAPPNGTDRLGISFGSAEAALRPRSSGDRAVVSKPFVGGSILSGACRRRTARSVEDTGPAQDPLTPRAKCLQGLPMKTVFWLFAGFWALIFVAGSLNPGLPPLPRTRQSAGRPGQSVRLDHDPAIALTALAQWVAAKHFWEVNRVVAYLCWSQVSPC